MRLRVPAWAVALALLAAPVSAVAGPTCLDHQGEMIRCGTPGAMPVGWTPPPDQERARLAARHDDIGLGRLVGLACLVGGLLALLALMPDFQGRWDAESWDGEEGRDRR